MSILATVCRCLLVFYNRNEVALGEVTCCWPSRGVSRETLDGVAPATAEKNRRF